MIWCPRPSPKTSYCSVPYSSAHPSLHFHYRSSSERRGSKSSWFCTLFHSCHLFWEKKRSWTLSVIFYIPHHVLQPGFHLWGGQDREVSDIFRGVRREGAELAGTPNTQSQRGSSSVVPSLPQLCQLRERASSPSISLFTAHPAPAPLEPPPAHSHHCWAQPTLFLSQLPLHGLPHAAQGG